MPRQYSDTELAFAAEALQEFAEIAAMKMKAALSAKGLKGSGSLAASIKFAATTPGQNQAGISLAFNYYGRILDQNLWMRKALNRKAWGVDAKEKSRLRREQIGRAHV